MKIKIVPLMALVLPLFFAACDGGGSDSDSASQGTWAIFVDDSATGANNGLSWADAFNNIQDGVNAAKFIHINVWVAEGTYTSGSLGPVLTMVSGVKVYGGFAGTETSLSERTDPSSHPTILDGQTSSYHVVIGADYALLDGFTVMNGNAITVDPDDSGGGMLNVDVSNLTVNNCIFQTNNASSSGAGMYNNNSLVTVTNCTFNNNSAGNGGGISNNISSQTITNCTFSGNTASSDGGGIDNYNNTFVLTNCIFNGNTAQRVGGGINSSYSIYTITDCTFFGNISFGDGGGVGNDSSSPKVTNCIFISNSASFYGGGISFFNSPSPTIANSTFIGNYSGDYGGAVNNYYNTSTSITNCILWGDNAAFGGPEIYNFNSTPTVTYSDIQGGYTGTGNINSDPLFVTGTLGDYYLSQPAGQASTSPCVDAGDFGSSSPGGTTATNDAPDTGTVDMGYHYPIP